MADEAEGDRSWWRTRPGALIAVAGLVSAITGLTVVLNQIGVWDDEPATSEVVESSGAPVHAYRVSFPQGTRATFSTSVIEVLSSRTEQRSPGELVLTLRLRMTNTSSKPAGFWSRTSRLLVDGVARAPVNALNELALDNPSVDGAVTFPLSEAADDASEDGAVTFALPEAADDLALQLLHLGDEARLPMEIRPYSG